MKSETGAGDRSKPDSNSANSGGEAELVLVIPLVKAARHALRFESYGGQPSIAGVSVHPLRKHRSGNGWFQEIFRLDEEGRLGPSHGEHAGFAMRQMSVSHAAAGRINAFHIHPRRGQNELWTVIHGLLTIWLVDCRQGSPTEGARRQLVLNGEEPVQLSIPAGVAHGYRAGPEGATLVYAMDQQFEVADPDEGRLPWDFWGAELWEEDRG